MDTVSLHTVLPEGVPEWVHLVPAGTFKGNDGRGPFKLIDPAAVIKASFAADKKLVIDENHSTDKAIVNGGSAPASGWIMEMQSREDGLWGRVDWTPLGQQLLADKAYRGFSPAFTRNAAGVVLRVLRASLTNAPNLGDLATLHTQQGSEMDLIELRAALGLPETADEAAMMAAATAGTAAIGAVTLHTQQLAAIAAAAGVTAATPEALVVELQTMRAASAPLATVTELQTQLTTLQNEGKRAKAVTFVDTAIKAGKPIAPVRDQMIEQHVTNPTATEALINGMPSINAGGVVVDLQTQQDGLPPLSAADKEVIERMGLDPVKYRENLKRMGEGVVA